MKTRIPFSRSESIASFWAKVEKRGEDECWGWKAKTDGGYGRMRWMGKLRGAHQISWLIHFGEIPAGMKVLHKCNNPICPNPNHLKVGTQLENMQDKRAAGNEVHGLFHGEDNPNARLNAAQVKEIRESEEAALVISSRFNISRRHVYGIRSKANWQHDRGKGLTQWS